MAFRYTALRALRTSQTLASAPLRQQLQHSRLATFQKVHALRAPAPKTLALVRWQSSGNVNKIDSKTEQSLGSQKLESHPELVSSTSSTHPINSEVGAESSTYQRGHRDDDADMLAGVRSDLQTIKDTFSLESVPREAYYVGMAGVLPYLATSLSTVYCSWEISHAAESGSGFLMSEKTAELALHIIEPLQIGYGAVIISFLGAIHWGLEFSGYGGYHGYNRYSIGVFAAAFAWPTILLPAEYALISQFLIFNFLYYTDARACKRGWTPQWYGVYRFVLTFIVGGSIIASLIGRGQIADKIGTLPGPTDRIRQFRESQGQMVEEEEAARRKFLAEEDEEEEEGGDDEEE